MDKQIFSQIISWLACALSLIGANYNIKKKVNGFYIWIIANFLWIVNAVIINQYAQIVVFFTYIILCIRGIYFWKKGI